MAFAAPASLAFIPANASGGAVCARRRAHSLRQRQAPRASQQPPEREREVAPDNDALQRELRMKVKELYGDVSNVSIRVNGDQAEFTVRREGDRLKGPSEYRQAVMTVTSIALLSVAAGLLFAGMYFSGAVHDSSSTIKNSESYSGYTRYDPYALLEDDL